MLSPNHPAQACCWQLVLAVVTGTYEDLWSEGKCPVSLGPRGSYLGLDMDREQARLCNTPGSDFLCSGAL